MAAKEQPRDRIERQTLLVRVGRRGEARERDHTAVNGSFFLGLARHAVGSI
ncbi:hypothetical protein M7I_0320 [Glarea lozoyensis 74030]|uniref:Uncharacterized protein n=1 Tax=Glarea lozoyensis (strain ATCC 74030 / MF5533) TaxID=1104152 RepID=H0ED20_GLAL7|nr:hypothetical protein M7I_0320 [Glarea lozoyensis 74030]